MKSVDFGVRQYRWEPEAPETVTAFIIARRKTIDNGWLDTARKIRQYLVSQGLQEVCVEIADVRDLDRAACKGPVKPRYAIGVEVDGLAAAAFGGYVDLQSPCTGQWLKFGLTCLDGVALEENLDGRQRAVWKRCVLTNGVLGYSRWRRDGVLDHDLAKPHLCLHSPSLRDLEESLREFDQELEGWRSCDTYMRGVQMEAEGLLDMMPKADRNNYPIVKSIIADTESFAKELRDFRDKNRYQLGHVVGASGKMASTCKSDSLKNINWALIEVQKRREGPNKVSSPPPYIRWSVLMECSIAGEGNCIENGVFQRSQ